MSKRIDPNVEINSDIKKLMQGFRPRIGSNEDIKIVDVYSKLLNIYTLMRDAHERARELNHITKTSVAQMDQIKDLEKTLTILMKKRSI